MVLGLRLVDLERPFSVEARVALDTLGELLVGFRMALADVEGQGTISLGHVVAVGTG